MLTVEARRVLAIRLQALDSRDFALVRECDWYLARLGVDRSVYETEPVMAVPPPPTRRTRTRGGLAPTAQQQ